MAKYSRFDPRNKKQSRNKQISMEKDLRIRHEEKSQKYNKQNIKYFQYTYEDGEKKW